MIDADPIAAAVRSLMTTRTVWTGKASDLLGALGEVVGERGVKSKSWPDSPRALSGRLRRAATFLRKIGIEIAFGREGRARTRTINITTHSALENQGAQPSTPSASSAPTQKASLANGFAPDALRTVAANADGSDHDGNPTVRAKPFKINAGNAADDADANLPSQSALEKPVAAAWSARL